MAPISPALIALLLVAWTIPDIHGSNIVVLNNCPHPVWVGTNGQREGNGHKWSDPGNGGFLLSTGQSRDLWVEQGWAGRLWGRTNCDSNGRCETGDCGAIECKGSGRPPATLAEWTMDGWDGLDFYDISLVDGGNLRMKMKPREGNCQEGSCPHDMTQDCPNELRVIVNGKVVGCDSKGGVPAFREYAERVCPKAYGYWNDDTKTLACRPPRAAGSIYDVTFC